MENIQQHSQSINSVLFITPYPDGSAPSQRFRIELFYNDLKNENIRFETRSFWNDDALKELYKKRNYFQKLIFVIFNYIRRFYHLFYTLKFDVVFIHREVLPFGSPIWVWIAKYILRRRIIFDFDDAIWIPHHSDSNKFMKIIRKLNQTKWQIKFSNFIYAGNNYLKSFAQQFNTKTKVIPTVVDTNYHSCDQLKNSTELVIGWTGSHSTLNYLNLVWPSIQKLSKKYKFTFIIICDREPQFKDKFVTYLPWSKEDEIQNLSKIDIGIMPLPEKEWAKGKCAFKAIQYMALEKPVVATKWGANTDIVQDQNTGFLVPKNDIDIWYKKLEQLIVDQKTREIFGSKGRERIVQNYSLRAVSKDFIGYLTHDDKAHPSK